MVWPPRAESVEREAMELHRLLIDGELVEATGGQRFTTIDPSNGRPLATVAAAAHADVDAAVAAARRAFGPWSAMSPAARSALVMDLADRVQAAMSTLA